MAKAKANKRWRVVRPDDIGGYFDMWSDYPNAEAVACLLGPRLMARGYKVIHVPKYAYHMNDGGIDESIVA